MVLPDVVCGPASERHDQKLDYRALVASPKLTALLDGISPHFHASDEAYWHLAFDLSLGKKRQGDSAGVAMGRISHSCEERASDRVGRSAQDALLGVVRTIGGGRERWVGIVCGCPRDLMAGGGRLHSSQGSSFPFDQSSAPRFRVVAFLSTLRVSQCTYRREQRWPQEL
jgi:hypothetical protein